MFRSGLITLAAALALAIPLAAPAHADRVSDFIAKWDPDHDRTLDLTEINKAADAEFDTLDVDHDGKLEPNELGKRVTKREFKAADADHDGSLDKPEYESIVAKRFKAANPDSDTAIDIAELKTKAGHHLLRLLQ